MGLVVGLGVSFNAVFDQRKTLSHIRLMSKQPKLRCETGHQASRFLRAKYPLTTTNKRKGSGDQPGNET